MQIQAPNLHGDFCRLSIHPSGSSTGSERACDDLQATGSHILASRLLLLREMDSSVAFGLGYYRQTSSSNTEGVDGPRLDETEDLMIQKYMQQCLDYHYAQQHQAPLPSGTQQPLHFVAPTQQAVLLEDEQAQATQQQELNQAEVITVSNKDTHRWSDFRPEPDAERIAEARRRAQAVVARFQAYQPPPSAPDTTSAHVIHDYEFVPSGSSMYKQQRDKALQRERERIQRALLKNLDYLIKSKERAMERLQQNNIDPKAKRHVFMPLSMAGIGSQQRDKVERKRQRVLHPSQQQSTHHQSTVAVYLSGLSVEGGDPSAALWQLFGAFGHVERVHLYKTTDHTGNSTIKGDGLVIYKISSVKEGRRLVEHVCAQAHGAEVAGCRLSVEPAHTNNQHNDQSELESDTGVRNSPKDTIQDEPAKPTENERQEDGELEAFFASL